MQDLSDILGQIIGAVMRMARVQLLYNSVNSVDYFRPWMAAYGCRNTQQVLTKVQSSLWHSRINKTMWEINYTYPFGYKYIPSRNVLTT